MGQFSDTDLKERIALSFMKCMTAELASKIVETFDSLHDFFELKKADLTGLPLTAGIRELLESRHNALTAAEAELAFVKRHNIKILSCIDEEAYPTRLYNSPGAPVNLFVLGNANLDERRILAVVGTRKATAYGLTYTSKIIEELHDIVGNTTIVSGLAYGIDKAAHEAALRLNMPTVAVVAHGLGMIYPAMHRMLATEILKAGGAIISEYPHETKPFRGRFLERNRIVAGMSDAVFVAESPVKGGALNTAAHARQFSREVFALPGRVTDKVSEGCNKLISRQLALLATSGKDIAYALGWDLIKEQDKNEQQPSLFDSYTGSIKAVYDFLKTKLEPCTLDNIVASTSLSAKEAMAALGEIDLDGLLIRHPGTRFSLL
ncbi:MAG: DNA-processing protein DprA [Prevotella sp.]|nr:DNA-processing protein DprA [Prevotella sp.]MCM1074689.1 DNA-processing protein DprA [Ruminococcus sp.]